MNKDNKIYICGMRINKPIPKSSYLAYLPVIKNLTDKGKLTFDSPITFLVGENGIGKSTLVEAIAVAYGFNPEGGTKNYNFRTKSSHSELCDYITLVKTTNFAKGGYFLRAESFYNTISYIDYLYQEQKTDNDYYDNMKKNEQRIGSLHKMSHGESFLETIDSFPANGLYILDEPEAALSPSGIMKLMSRIDLLVKQGCQFIISTHSPMLITMPNADIYQLSKGAIEKVNYEETDHFIITRKFLNSPSQMLEHLLKE